jgi:hypothetical protein
MLGDVPVAAVFAREITPALTSLVKKLEKATADNKDAKVAAWVILLTDDDKAEEKLKELADKEKVKKVMLGIESPGGPPKYKIAKEADVTVLLYAEKTVKKSYVFEKGKLTEKDATNIAAAVKDIIPEKKEPAKDK